MVDRGLSLERYTQETAASIGRRARFCRSGLGEEGEGGREGGREG